MKLKSVRSKLMLGFFAVIGVFLVISFLNYYLFTTATDFENSGIIALVAILIGLLFSMILAVLLTNRLSKVLAETLEHARKLETGQFTAEPLTIQTKDEIGEIGGSLNQMQINLQRFLSDVNNATKTMLNESDELTQAAGEVNSITKQVADTMQELSAGIQSSP